MKIRFWGVRGSIATPISAAQIQSKIVAVVAAISARDIESENARQSFIANLPEYIYGTIGGNTACLEIKNESGDRIILDAGTGIRACGKQYVHEKNAVYHLLFSHFHWDHIQGLPFFDPAYKPGTTLNIYSDYPNMRRFLREQMQPPYFPVKMEALTKNIVWHDIKDNVPFKIGSTEVMTKSMFHPGGSHAYLFMENGKRFIYATDVELQQRDFQRTEENAAFFENTDVLVLDSQYTIEETAQKEGWGHSAFCYAIDFAVFWNIRHLYLFHHEPMYDDKKIHTILKSAQWYSDYVCGGKVIVHLAMEGREIDL
ncbi:MBL fold metallo-hydrolase [Treponema sp. HNW]|uniref:MBL fold metallo-hydrolase n=1 Tax=Treponema sp. HNW TaxID=3116654 RepID=UPI003D14A1AF